MLTTTPLWTWDTSLTEAPYPFVTAYASGKDTKTGLQPDDLKNFAGVPLQYYGNPPVLVDTTTLLGWIRAAEDWVENQTGLLLSQAWIASPPAITPQQCLAIDISPQGPGGYQQPGYDFDLSDAAYDFYYVRARDEGWMNYTLRYKPLKSINYTPASPTALKNATYLYPLLNAFFQVPESWIVEDHDFSLIRFVPSTNVQMLPLFAMQLAFMGFAESVPGAIWLQYTSGLTSFDYKNRYNFILQLVLAAASVMALSTVQGGINLGIQSQSIVVDGLQYKTTYDKDGPYAGLIRQFERQRDMWLITARNMVAGPVLTTI